MAVAVGLVIAIVAVGLFVIQGRGAVPARVPVSEDSRDEVRFIAAAERPGDVIVMNLSAQWGFAYYDRARPKFVRADDVSTGFKLAPRAGVFIAKSRLPTDEQSAFAAARAAQTMHCGARIWVLLSHISPPELARWKRMAMPFHPQERRFLSDTLFVLAPSA
jgi:hypothetical protein